MSENEKDQCAAVLLGIYQKDYELELNRAERIEGKASTLFNYTSAIPTVLVGLFALGQTIRTQTEMSGESLFSAIYFISIILFIFAGYVSTLSLRIQEYPSVLLTRNRSKIDENLKLSSLKLTEKRIGLLLDATTELEELNEKKARRLYYAQLVMALAVFLVMVSMGLLVLATFTFS